MSGIGSCLTDDLGGERDAESSAFVNKTIQSFHEDLDLFDGPAGVFKTRFRFRVREAKGAADAPGFGKCEANNSDSLCDPVKVCDGNSRSLQSGDVAEIAGDLFRAGAVVAYGARQSATGITQPAFATNARIGIPGITGVAVGRNPP